MNFKELSFDKLLDLAENSSNEQELSKLANTTYMNVRRAVARNRNITQNIANMLVNDPVLNVSYMAAKNSKSTTQRVFNKESLTDCIQCEIREKELNCTNCEGKNRHAF